MAYIYEIPTVNSGTRWRVNFYNPKTKEKLCFMFTDKEDAQNFTDLYEEKFQNDPMYNRAVLKEIRKRDFKKTKWMEKC